MKQLDDKVFTQVRDAICIAESLTERSLHHPKILAAIAALDTAQQEPVNQVLLKALSALLTHSGMDEDEWSKPTFDQARAAIKLATTKTKECGMCGYVGTEADAVGQCPRCHWDELQLQKPAQQAQPVCGYDDTTGNCTRVNCCKQAQPERAPLSDDEIKELYIKAPGHCVGFARAIEVAHGIKQAQPEPFTPDWSQDSAAAESIREHQAICNLLLREMRHIAGISTGQVKRVAEQALEAVKQAQPERALLSDDEIQTIYLRTYNEGFHGRNLEIAFARAIEAAIKQGGQQAQPEQLTDSYVQTVPDKCDRIVWRNKYYHLPLKESK